MDMETSNIVDNRQGRKLSAVLRVTGLWLVVWLVFFLPALPRSTVLAPLDIMDSLLEPWATADAPHVKNAFVYDTISQYIPYDFSVYRSLQDDGYVGWNPDTHSGTAIRENAMLCPGDFRHLLYRVMPFWDAWDWGRMMNFAIAGIGMILLLSQVGLSPLFILIGAISFSFYSQFVVWIYTGVMMAGFCWAPWILWALLREKALVLANPMQTWLSWVLSVMLPGVFIGFGLRNGFLHTTLFTATLLVLYYIAECILLRKESTRSVRRRLGVVYGLSLVLGLAIASTVLVHVIPPAMSCGRQLAERSWGEALKTLPTLITSFLPTIMGTPQGLDATKYFSSDMFNLKFGGCNALILAILALFRKESPCLPKILFVVSLVIPFTPLDTWFYSRSTVIFALGMAWLAAWYLTQARDRPPSRTWVYVGRAFALVVVGWLAASVCLVLFEDTISEILRKVVERSLPANKASRLDWMLGRATEFVSRSKVWHPYNLATLTAIGLGLFGCSRVNNRTRRLWPVAALITVCTFAEMALFASTWIKISPRPAGKDAPYASQPWVEAVKAHLGNGSLFFYDRSNFDYMQLNTPSAYGIRQCQGYESIKPKRLFPLRPLFFDPEDFALAGVSHVLAPPGVYPEVLKGWEKVMDAEELVLYANPAFKSIFVAHLASGESVPLYAEVQTANRRTIMLPKGTVSVDIAESYHRNWRYLLGEGESALPSMAPDGYYAMRIVMEEALTQKTKLVLSFRP